MTAFVVVRSDVRHYRGQPLAFPAIRTVVEMKDTSSPDMTIKVTGYPCKLRYDYLGEDVSFSDLSTAREQIEDKVPKGRTTFSGSETRCSS